MTASQPAPEGHQITFAELRIFLEFSRSEHLGRCAEALGLSVPSVQRAVRQLELRLGVPLLEPDGRRVRLLHAGRVLADHAERMLRARRDAMEAVTLAAGRIPATLRIAHSPSLGPQVVPRLVAGLLARAPETRIQLRLGLAPEALAALLANEVDAAMVSGAPVDSDFCVVPLFSEEVVLSVSVDDPLASRDSIDLAECSERRFAALAEGSASRGTMLAACARAGFRPKIVIETNDLFTLEGIVGTGVAISVVPSRMSDYRHPRIVRLPLVEATRTRREVSLVYIRNRLPPPLAIFLEIIEAERRHNGLLAHA